MILCTPFKRHSSTVWFETLQFQYLPLILLYFSTFLFIVLLYIFFCHIECFYLFYHLTLLSSFVIASVTLFSLNIPFFLLSLLFYLHSLQIHIPMTTTADTRSSISSRQSHCHIFIQYTDTDRNK